MLRERFYETVSYIHPRSELISKSSSCSSVSSSSRFSVKIPVIPETTLLEEADKPSFKRLNQLFWILSPLKITRLSYYVDPTNVLSSITLSTLAVTSLRLDDFRILSLGETGPYNLYHFAPVKQFQFCQLFTQVFCH